MGKVVNIVGPAVDIRRPSRGGGVGNLGSKGGAALGAGIAGAGRSIGDALSRRRHRRDALEDYTEKLGIDLKHASAVAEQGLAFEEENVDRKAALEAATREAGLATDEKLGARENALIFEREKQKLLAASSPEVLQSYKDIAAVQLEIALDKNNAAWQKDVARQAYSRAIDSAESLAGAQMLMELGVDVFQEQRMAVESERKMDRQISALEDNAALTASDIALAVQNRGRNLIVENLNGLKGASPEAQASKDRLFIEMLEGVIKSRRSKVIPLSQETRELLQKGDSSAATRNRIATLLAVDPRLEELVPLRTMGTGDSEGVAQVLAGFMGATGFRGASELKALADAGDPASARAAILRASRQEKDTAPITHFMEHVEQLPAADSDTRKQVVSGGIREAIDGLNVMSDPEATLFWALANDLEAPDTSDTENDRFTVLHIARAIRKEYMDRASEDPAVGADPEAAKIPGTAALRAVAPTQALGDHAAILQDTVIRTLDHVIEQLGHADDYYDRLKTAHDDIRLKTRRAVDDVTYRSLTEHHKAMVAIGAGEIGALQQISGIPNPALDRMMELMPGFGEMVRKNTPRALDTYRRGLVPGSEIHKRLPEITGPPAPATQPATPYRSPSVGSLGGVLNINPKGATYSVIDDLRHSAQVGRATAPAETSALMDGVLGPSKRTLNFREQAMEVRRSALQDISAPLTGQQENQPPAGLTSAPSAPIPSPGQAPTSQPSIGGP